MFILIYLYLYIYNKIKKSSMFIYYLWSLIFACALYCESAEVGSYGAPVGPVAPLGPLIQTISF